MTTLAYDDLLPRVISAVAACAPDDDVIAGPSKLVDDLGFSSLALLELVTELCLEFEIEPVSEEDLLSVSTVDDVVEVVRRALA